ncbi:MAG: acyl-CoA thioesterase II [Gammaproteobacteria bacterium]|nr:MAG: acyl-CoA thioesterase II [Gammaproteobacteria bacterium]PIE37106.1 MAG: acyl-CoA thioesterase II [Gammaproteobacteria bacterium]
MNDSLQQLLNVLTPRKTGEGRFEGENMHPEMPRLYGGQVLAQSIFAAVQTVPDDRELHSQHVYFLRPGNPREPVTYEVEVSRDGFSFSARRVTAIQGGKPIYVAAMSFQAPSIGEEFQTEMPDVPAPETLICEHKRAKLHGSMEDAFAVITGPELDVRMVEPIDWNRANIREPQLEIWMRTRHPFEGGRGINKALLAYMSDAFLIDVCLVTKGMDATSRHIQLASLDHVLWFHAPFRADEWLLYVVQTERMSAGRGLANGRFYTRDGVLVATCMQQALMRGRSAP